MTKRGARRAIAVLASVLATRLHAGLVPGGGPPASDCYAELDVEAVENGTSLVRANRRVICTDGDPCDTGPCGDAVCDVRVRLCWNQRDPNVAACLPPAALDSLVLRGPLAALVLLPRSFDSRSCSEPVVVAVPTTADGTRAGILKVRLQARAPDGVTPRVDRDAIKLVCRPRPFAACPMPTTTTTSASTTTTPTTSTSTTTRRRMTTTTTTRPRRTTTSTTRLPTTTTTRRRRTTTTSTSTSTSTTTARETTSTTSETTTTTTSDTTTTTRRRRRGGNDQGDLVVTIGLT